MKTSAGMIARHAVSDRFELLEGLPAGVAVEDRPAQRRPERILHAGLRGPTIRAGGRRPHPDGEQQRLVTPRGPGRRRGEAAGAELAAALRGDPVAGPRLGEGGGDLDHRRVSVELLPTFVGCSSTLTRSSATSTRWTMPRSTTETMGISGSLTSARARRTARSVSRRVTSSPPDRTGGPR